VWNTDYDCYCGDTYSVGKYKSITPSLKFQYNSGKKPGKGLILGVGLGSMFAKDRGTEQTYKLNAETDRYEVGSEIRRGKWDFNSIAPSFTVGAGFRLLRVPITLQANYYWANTTEGWMIAAGGLGVKVGLSRK
jgi:hypothetical protein